VKWKELVTDFENKSQFLNSVHLEVMPPKRTNLVLTADVPNGEADVLIFDGFDVEA